jgi:hypothetical protein
MGTTDRSLRFLVEKWLGLTPAIPVRVTHFGRMRSNQRRYVCIESWRPAGALTIYFFLHPDGVWYVFPPEVERPAMSVA